MMRRRAPTSLTNCPIARSRVPHRITRGSAVPAIFGGTLLASIVASGLTASPAHAQQPGCPPGSWFCADAQATTPPAQAPAQPPSGTVQLQPLPPAQIGQVQVGQAQAGQVIVQTTPQTSQQVVVQPGQQVTLQQPQGTTTIIVQRRGAPARPAYTPPPPPNSYQGVPPGYVIMNPNPEYYRQREWGMNLSLQGALIDSGRRSGGMGGFGVGLRYKASPFFGVEGSLNGYGGTDGAGDRRSEFAMQLNGMLFVNPRSRSQLYFLGGVGVGSASVSSSSYETINGFNGTRSSSDPYAASRGDGKYTYAGMQIGVGMEFRFAAHVAANIDLRGFMRGRTDGGGGYEFIASDGRATNTSGGGLVTGGVTYYF